MRRDVLFALRAAIISASFLLAVGCASVQVSTSAATHIKRVGVVSILSDRFQGRYIGTTVFNNKFYEADVSAWHLDTDVAGYVIKKLRGANFIAGRLDISPHSADEFYEQGHFNLGLNARLFHGLPALAAKQGYDTLVVVMRPFNSDYKAYVPGYGFGKASFFGLSYSDLFASFTLFVFDAKTGRQLAQADGMMTGNKADKDIEWKPSFAQYTAQQQSVIKQRIEDRLRAELDVALPATHLISAN